MGRAETGKNGEKLTAEYLKQKGYLISAMNYHSRFGEIDIIAENEEYIVFVEVKTRKINSMVLPLEAVNYSKQRKIILTAENYLIKYPTEKQPRFDVSEVYEFKSNDLNSRFQINIIENAFLGE